MIARVLAAIAALCGVDALDAVQAQAMVERAIMPTIGCYVMRDLEDIIHSGLDHRHLNIKVRQQALDKGLCFHIQTGAQAMSDRLWEPYPMMWNGIIKLRGIGPRFFYSPAVAWHATRW